MLGCYLHFVPCQEKKILPIDEIDKGVKKGNKMNDDASFCWKVDSKYVKFGSAIGGRK